MIHPGGDDFMGMIRRFLVVMFFWKTEKPNFYGGDYETSN